MRAGRDHGIIFSSGMDPAGQVNGNGLPVFYTSATMRVDQIENGYLLVEEEWREAKKAYVGIASGARLGFFIFRPHLNHTVAADFVNTW